MFQTTNQKSYDYEFTTIFPKFFPTTKPALTFSTSNSAQAAVQDGTMMFHRLALPNFSGMDFGL